MQVLVWLQDVGRRVEDIIKELCEEQSGALVLLLSLVELALQALMLLQQCVVLLPLYNHVTLLLLQLLLQEVDQVVIALSKLVAEGAVPASRVRRSIDHHVIIPLREAGRMGAHGTRSAHHSLWTLDLVERLCVGELLLEPLDHFLAEVASLGELLLDLLVDLDLALVRLDLRLHLVVLEDEDLGLLRLVLKLGRQLMVLEDSQMRGCLQLLVVHGQQVCLCLLDVEEHLFAQLLSLFYPIELLLVDLLQSETLLVLQPLLKISRFTFHLVLLL